MDTLLSNESMLESLSSDDLAMLTKGAELQSIPKNTLLVKEGDDTDSLYVIQSGKVKIYLGGEEGKEVILNTPGPGEYFGEVALLDAASRMASVMTLEDSSLFVITKAEFERFLMSNPEISLRIIIGLTRILRGLTESVKSLALMDVYGRIANTLIKLAEQTDGKMVINRHLTHREIASMVGSSREMVSRIMQDLSKGGYITATKTSITINEKLPAHW